LNKLFITKGASAAQICKSF